MKVLNVLRLDVTDMQLNHIDWTIGPAYLVSVLFVLFIPISVYFLFKSFDYLYTCMVWL